MNKNQKISRKSEDFGCLTLDGQFTDRSRSGENSRNLRIVHVQPFLQQLRIAGEVFHEAGVTAGAEEFPAGIGDPVKHGFGDVGRAEIVPTADNKSGFFDRAEFIRDIEIF